MVITYPWKYFEFVHQSVGAPHSRLHLIMEFSLMPFGTIDHEKIILDIYYAIGTKVIKIKLKKPIFTFYT